MNRTSVSAVSRRVFWLLMVWLLAACGATRWESAETPVGKQVPAQVPSEPTPVRSGRAQQSVTELLEDYYATWRGTPYRFGGTSRRGIDCSAFTQQAMRRALGVRLPRTTSQQITQGQSIPRRLIRPGDLVFFKTGETLNHVGVIVGPGKFMHASTRKGVTISRLDDSYWRSRVIDYRRVLD